MLLRRGTGIKTTNKGKQRRAYRIPALSLPAPFGAAEYRNIAHQSNIRLSGNNEVKRVKVCRFSFSLPVLCFGIITHLLLAILPALSGQGLHILSRLTICPVD